MLEYRVNANNFNKTRLILPVENVTLLNFDNLYDSLFPPKEEETNEDSSQSDTQTNDTPTTENSESTEVKNNGYVGNNQGKTSVTCECSDIDKVTEGSFVNVVSNLFLDYGFGDERIEKQYTFSNDYQVAGVNKGDESFYFFIDNKYPLKAKRITSVNNGFESGVELLNEENGPDKLTVNVEEIQEELKNYNVFLYFEDNHYFDTNDYLEIKESGESTEGSEEEVGLAETEQKIPIYFKYFAFKEEETETETTQTDSSDSSDTGQQQTNTETKEKELKEVSVPVNFSFFSPKVLVTSYSAFETDEQKELYKYIFKQDLPEQSEGETEQPTNVSEIIEGDLSGVEVSRDRFLFGEKTDYEFSFERTMAELNIPITNTFETNLFQMELLNEHFVNAEKAKAINRIVDLEKDVYYPCIKDGNTFTDVYTIKFNLHFREHRGDDWLIDNNIDETEENPLNKCFWNGVVWNDTTKKAEIAKDENNKPLTSDNRSDLLTFLNFTNTDVHYQKNKLKKSFLRLLYYDSMNPGKQNLLGYSTIFYNTGALFGKYTKFIEENGYTQIGADKKVYGTYNPKGNKQGIRVDRDILGQDVIEEKRLSSQFVTKSKNTTRASSEGFYIYIWKDNELALPQDLYMKVEFNHAGYGRTIPFMMPYWDKKKWSNKEGIKPLQQILNDWNAKKTINGTTGIATWTTGTDGHYGIRQYTKFSYIHLKYQYDKTSDKHYYYLDPDTYGNIVFPNDVDGNKCIEINLYEAKVE